MSGPILTLAGYDKLRPGRIHLFCPCCGRKQSNTPRFGGHAGMERDTADPKTAVVAVVKCCGSSGDKDCSDPDYYTRDLKLVRTRFQRGIEEPLRGDKLAKLRAWFGPVLGR